jgi:hypothetical protein
VCLVVSYAELSFSNTPFHITEPICLNLAFPTALHEAKTQL